MFLKRKGKNKMAKGNKGQKCRRFGKTKRKVCVDFSGGKGRGGKGKKCIRFKTKTVKICRDFS